MHAFLVILAAVSTGAVLVLPLHMVAAGLLWPEWLERTLRGPGSFPSEPLSRKVVRLGYIAGAVIGYGVMGYAGASVLLAWLPDSVGAMDDGEWRPLRLTLASVIAAVFALSMLLALVKLAALSSDQARRDRSRQDGSDIT